jgi:hypothetical protein
VFEKTLTRAAAALAIAGMASCGKWVHVGEETISSKPILGPIESGSKQLVATSSVRNDGNVEIDVRVELAQCFQLSTPHLKVVDVEKYEVGKSSEPELVIGTSLAIVLAGAAVIALNINEPIKQTDDPAEPGITQGDKNFFLGAGAISAGLGLLGTTAGVVTAVQKKRSPRKRVKATRPGSPTRVDASCPPLKPLDQITVVTPWGDRLESKLDHGKGVLAIDWRTVASRNQSGLPSGSWKLVSGTPPHENDWRPSASEQQGFVKAFATERGKLDLAEIARWRRDVGPPNFSLVSATSEYDVVPAGLPAKLTVRVKNTGPGPADNATLVLAVPGAGETRAQIGPLAVGATVDRELSITLGATHPGGELRIPARITDPGATKPTEINVTLTAVKQQVGPATVVIEKLEAKGQLRAGARGELRLVARNEGTANAYGVAISMTSPKTPALDSLKYRIPYIKAGATVDIAIPIELPREIEDPNPSGLVNATVVNGSSRCAGALTNCYAKLAIKPPPMPILEATCTVVEGATEARDKRLTANAGVTLAVRCRIENRGDEAARITPATGFDRASSSQPAFDLAPGAIAVSTFKIAVPRDSVAMSEHELVVELSAPHATTIQRKLAFKVGRVALCAPNSLDKAEYKRKTGELKRSVDAGEITQKDYDDIDAELLSCLKK